MKLKFWLFRQCNENARVLRNLFLSRKLLAGNILINPIFCEPFVASGISFPSMIVTMKKNCPIMKQVKTQLSFSIFARPVPLTFVSQTIFSSVAKFIVPDWGI
jgi:hypothetical protein